MEIVAVVDVVAAAVALFLQSPHLKMILAL